MRQKGTWSDRKTQDKVSGDVIDETELSDDEEFDGDFDEVDLSDDEDYDEDGLSEDGFDEEDDDRAPVNVKILIPVVAVVAVIALAAILFLVFTGKRSRAEMEEALSSVEDVQGQELDGIAEGEADSLQDGTDKDNLESSETAMAEDMGTAETDRDSQDPQETAMGTEQGTAVDVNALLSSGNVSETADVTMGIDVARYQGTIDWSQVAAAGIDFAMVRVGYRAEGSREICADSNAKYNMQEAQKNGIKVGAYFFSTAVSTEEAIAEADWVADYISQYQITYPVAFDCEGFDKPGSVQSSLTNAQRTDIAIAFMQRIYDRGYTPMFYAAMGELTGNAKWDTDRIAGTFKIWVSQYPAVPYPETKASSYGGVHAMWQYTNRGTVAGIGYPVDVNIAYFGYEKTAEALNTEKPEEVRADVEALMNFTAVNENVTAKDATNLRDIPSQGADSTVVYTLQNGETVTRTGVSDSGWSRIEYNGQTLYAVSNYLTTDLGYKAPVQEGAESGDGLKTKFAERNEQVTAKIEVNLRTLPSVTNPDVQVAAVLHNGEYVTRTGINEAYGWSRVEYNGQTLYCISSYLTQ